MDLQYGSLADPAEPCAWWEDFIVAVQQATGIRLPDDLMRFSTRGRGASLHLEENAR